jgi:integrase/recombinase XerD
LRLHEKGGRRHEVPCHPSLEVHLDDWIKATGIVAEKTKPLFRCVHKGDNLTCKAMSRFDIVQRIKRRAKEAGLPYSTCCHTLEYAQTIANHESPRTTKLYDRTREELSLDEIEKIKI